MPLGQNKLGQVSPGHIDESKVGTSFESSIWNGERGGLVSKMGGRPGQKPVIESLSFVQAAVGPQLPPDREFPHVPHMEAKLEARHFAQE